MPRRIALQSLNATTAQIINTIRDNAGYEYQQNVPAVDDEHTIVQVGQAIMGAPAFRNTFVNALLNRIALVVVNSMTFNNVFRDLKKGYLELGETVEEIFVELAKVVDYNPEKAPQREFQRTIPNIHSAFHKINWRVMYPVTIQNEDLRQAFTSFQGVENLIAKIIEQVYQAAEYDEFLLFKYMLIKAISHGQMYAVGVDTADIKNAAKAFRGFSNLITFPSTEYNELKVTNNTPKDRQYIFMDSMFNAEYDVDVLAAAFNMDKATFMGRLILVDNFGAFDNRRWEELRAANDSIEEVTAAELALTSNVKAITVDSQWFQVYDNLAQFTEQYSGSGLYWNYWYHQWKTVSHSPFANAICFVEGVAPEAPATINFKIDTVSTNANSTVITLVLDDTNANVAPNTVVFSQTRAAIEKEIAVERYGAFLIPAAEVGNALTIEATLGNTVYTGSVTPNTASAGATVTLTKQG